jgi:hypothetical protein
VIDTSVEKGAVVIEQRGQAQIASLRREGGGEACRKERKSYGAVS